MHPQCRDILEHDHSEQLGKGGRKLKQRYSYNGSGRQSGGGVRKRVKSEAQVPIDPCGLPGDLDWISLLSSQRVSCGSCPSQACRPVYGSPILGPSDLGQVGDPMICSPLVVPATIANSPVIPTVADTDGLKVEEEEDIFNNHSNSPNLLPWADSRPQSPCLHPWAESKETTLTNLARRNPQPASLSLNRTTPNSMTLWSPEPNYSSSHANSSCLSYKHKLKPTESYIYNLS